MKIIVGILIGWLTVGLLLAGSASRVFWSEWQQAKIITLLEEIALNTKK